jgi:hypothetical protein
MQRIIAILVVLVSALQTQTALGQATLRRHVGASLYDLFGAPVAGLGDVTGDGLPDYAIGSAPNTPI